MNLPAPLQQALQLSQAGNHAEAEKVCKRALADDPSDARIWCHLGTCYLSMSRFPDAIKAYEQAVKRQPRFAEAVNNIGVAYARLGKVDQAIATFMQARALRPTWAEPSISLGNLFVTHERFDEALEAYSHAARSEPNNPEPQTLIGSIHGRLGLLEDGSRHFREGLRLNPRNAVAHSNLLLAMNYDPDADPSIVLNEHRWFDRLHGQGLAPIPPHVNSREPDRPLRIGYLSPDLRRHAVAWFMLPVFQSHDPNQFKLYCYAAQADMDAISDQFRKLSSGWKQVLSPNDAQVADMIRADGIDILVDLAGHTSGNRLTVMGRRPAPVQVTYLGYPNTTGMSAVDFWITDAIADPADLPTYATEQVTRLPGCFCCFAPHPDVPDVAPPPCVAKGHVTFGLLHKLAKYNPMMLDLWTRILHAVPDSRLLVHRDSLDKSVQDRLMQEFTSRGIERGRIELDKKSAKEGAHYAVYSRIDISLDSLPWSGHTTSCESMWMGVPFITMRSKTHAGRMAASILQTVGVDELIAEDEEEFVRIAVELAGDVERIKRYRQTLRDTMKRSALCDAKSFTRGLESAYRQMWRTWCEKMK